MKNREIPIYEQRSGGTHGEILKEIEASRRAISRDFASVREGLDFKTRTQQAITTRPLPWLGGAAALGWLLAGRRKKSRKPARGGTSPVVEKETVKSLGILSVLLATFRILLPIIRPVATAYAAKRFADLAAKVK